VHHQDAEKARKAKAEEERLEAIKKTVAKEKEAAKPTPKKPFQYRIK
jgi:hypothetical protein